MSLFASLHPQLDLTRDRSDGRCALTNITLQYPTSDARHELFARGPPASSFRPPFSPQASPPRTCDKYPIPDMREVCPGILATGQLTENHPLVNTYLDVLARIMPRAPSKPSVSSASSPVHPSAALASATNSTSATIPAPGVLTYWQSEQGGIASWNTVSNLISQQFQLFPGHISRLYAAEVPKLTTAQQQSIFALAALKVLNHPTHPAHFALWAKNVILRTADTVDAVIRTSFVSVLPHPIILHFARVPFILYSLLH